jgi:hypothetical protein
VETFLFNQRQVVQGALHLYAQQDADAEAYEKLGEVVDEAVKDQEKEDVIARQKLTAASPRTRPSAPSSLVASRMVT